MPLFRSSKDNDYQLAARMLADGQVEQALEMLRQIVSQHPNHADSLTTLGVAIIQSLGDEKDPALIKEAISYLDRAAALKPKDPVPVFNKAVCLRDLGSLEEALNLFDKVLEIENRFALAILHKAEINYELENYEEAIELARLAIIRDPAVANTMHWVKDAMEKAGLLDKDGNPIEKPPKQPRMF